MTTHAWQLTNRGLTVTVSAAMRQLAEGPSWAHHIRINDDAFGFPVLALRSWENGPPRSRVFRARHVFGIPQEPTPHVLVRDFHWSSASLYAWAAALTPANLHQSAPQADVAWYIVPSTCMRRWLDMLSVPAITFPRAPYPGTNHTRDVLVDPHGHHPHIHRWCVPVPPGSPDQHIDQVWRAVWNDMRAACTPATQVPIPQHIQQRWSVRE